ncbi:hypothetical protein GSI_10470 [Ganoderma sinense ZZ0214-1]|uniref:Uncharacterized protein n=1 Tax=Ganoderma sinense ZZ0214-1 TaxID=1077348 RepID=A0A2G8S0M5_9APHY|nr:hypothetical protein GSI_10470 [Ganoderma sinense ZZ0214-1]
MSAFVVPSENNPLRSILLNPTTNATQSTTEPPQSNPSTPRLTHETLRPQLSFAIPEGLHDAIGQGPRRRLQRRRGSPPPPPPPPTNTPTIQFGTEPQGPSLVRRRRALQKLSTNGALRPPRPRGRHGANSAIEVELENAAPDSASRAIPVDDDTRRATAQLEHAMATDPYVLLRSSYPANWVVHNDRVQHSEEPW